MNPKPTHANAPKKAFLIICAPFVKRCLLWVSREANARKTVGRIYQLTSTMVEHWLVRPGEHAICRYGHHGPGIMDPFQAHTQRV
jgi:hypothetical protein